MVEIQKLSGEIKFNDLTYHFKSPNLAPNLYWLQRSIKYL